MSGIVDPGKIKNIILEAGKIMLSASDASIKGSVEEKSGTADFVTKYDKAVQSFLETELSKVVPGAGFFAEEEGGSSEGDGIYTFIIDPIDGTTNFIHDYGMSVISVALLKDREQYMGFVYQPYTEEMFFAKRGEGAFLNGKPIHVSDTPAERSLVEFGTSPYNAVLRVKTMKIAAEVINYAGDLRRCGSAAMDLCYLAAGRADAFYELKLSPWDYAAGSLIVAEAGGSVTRINGEPLSMTEAGSVWGTNGKNGEILTVIRETLERMVG